MSLAFPGRRLLAAAGLLLALGMAPLAAQVSPQKAAELLQKNASLVRQRIQESGLSPDEIRARLQAAGYPATLLDPYLAAAAPAAGAEPEVNEQMLKALDVLAPTPPKPQGTEKVSVEVGAQAPPAAPAPPPPPAAAAGPPGTGLSLFGLDVFRGRTTQFQPMLTGPVPPNYKIGPGDVMVLVITGDVEFVHELAVTREGFIVIPQVGQLYVNNLTMEQLRALLRQRLGRSYSGISAGTTRFDVTISRLRTNQVFVIGEVVQPGAYELASVATVLNSLYAAGGPTERGNFRQVVVQRQGAVASRLDLYDYLLHADTKNDIMLEQGDVVFVPPRGARVALSGAVLRPAIYELKPGETLYQLIRYAGGLLAPAALHRARISRILPPSERRVPGVDRTVFDVGLAEVLSDSARAPVMADGDEVRVFTVREEVRNVVTLEGSVWQPGSYGYRPGLKAWDLIRMGLGLRPDTYLPAAQIVRLNLVDSTLSIIPFSLDTAQDGSGVQNPELREFDVVRVFSRAALEPPHRVEVTGAVRNPGTLPRFQGMTLRDAILRSGGLIPETYTGRAFISRLQPDSTRRLIPVELRVDSLMVPLNQDTLEDFDVINVYALAKYLDQFPVTIAGEVRDPGSERYQEGMTLRDLIIRAGGLKPTADLTVEVSRLSDPEKRSSGEIARVTRVRVDSSYIVPEGASRFYLGFADSLRVPAGDSAAAFLLKPYDHVFVRRIPDFELPRVVTVAGEVRYPGRYVLQRKDERLREVLERAGGLTAWAFPEGFRMYRNGRLVNVDLPQVLRHRGHRDNVVLQPGDSLVVPEYNPVVVVEGAVNAPSSVLYRRGAPLDYYIQNAGGYARNADKARVHVRYANGAARVKSKFLFFTAFTPEPGPGSVITVPAKPEGEPFKTTEFFASLAQIAVSLVAIVAIATRP